MQRDIVEQARRGSESAFEQIVATVLGHLHALATDLLHDRTLAEDAVQETLLQAWRDLPHLRDVDHFEPWLHSVLAHRCLDLARHRKTDAAVLLPAGLADPTDFSGEVASRDLVRRGMQRLRPHLRTVLILRYFFGLSVPQIARTLHVPIGTAKSRLHAAEAAMRATVSIDDALAAAA